MPHPTFHSACDGRGLRHVHVNGNEITHVLWCDTDAGVVVFVPQPMRVKRTARDKAYTRRLRGRVTVTPFDGD
ncbi:Prophage PssSM-02, Orf42 [Pseudomonas savastanoi pv. phaseolicola]|nr:Prophage PssSM-02, Orf42 [Pseudomonas savastanoi pv. phaseolicola]